MSGHRASSKDDGAAALPGFWGATRKQRVGADLRAAEQRAAGLYSATGGTWCLRLCAFGAVEACTYSAACGGPLPHDGALCGEGRRSIVCALLPCVHCSRRPCKLEIQAHPFKARLGRERPRSSPASPGMCSGIRGRRTSSAASFMWYVGGGATRLMNLRCYRYWLWSGVCSCWFAGPVHWDGGRTHTTKWQPDNQVVSNPHRFSTCQNAVADRLFVGRDHTLSL